MGSKDRRRARHGEPPGPLQALLAGAGRIASGDFSARIALSGDGDFQPLAVALNDMAERLGRQFTALATASGIDRAVLSATDRDGIVSTLLASVPDLVSCDAVGLTLYDGATKQGTMWSWGGRPGERVSEVSAAADPWPLQDLGGVSSIVRLSTIPASRLFEPMAAAGITALTLLPIATAQGLRGAVCLGYRDSEAIRTHDLVQVRRLADQVAVALSNVQMIEHLAIERERLATRSSELTQINEALHREMAQRERAERALRESEEQQRQSQKLEAIGRLAGGVAHDFNNLLTVIASYTEMALTTIPADQPLHDDLHEVQLASQRAAALTRQLLTFSRKQPGQPTVVDLNRVVQGIEKMLQRLIGEDIRLEIRCSSDPALIEADPGQLDQILLNLVVNSRDAMPSGGRIVVGVGAADGDEAEALWHHGLGPEELITLTVTDSGVGMDRATQARVFEPFFTTKEAGQGTGLGLSTVYGIVGQSGGVVRVDSEVGVGTTFTLLFRRTEHTAWIADDGDVAPPGHGQETILLVEDEPHLRALVAKVLNGFGYRVLSAGDGPSALQAMAQEDGLIQLIIADIVMPGMSGKDLVDEIWSRYGPTRALFISGYTDDVVLRSGVDPLSILPKPFLPNELAQRVRLVLDRPGPSRVSPDQAQVPPPTPALPRVEQLPAESPPELVTRRPT